MYLGRIHPSRPVPIATLRRRWRMTDSGFYRDPSVAGLGRKPERIYGDEAANPAMVGPPIEYATEAVLDREFAPSKGHEITITGGRKVNGSVEKSAMPIVIGLIAIVAIAALAGGR